MVVQSPVSEYHAAETIPVAARADDRPPGGTSARAISSAIGSSCTRAMATPTTTAAATSATRPARARAGTCTLPTRTAT